MQQRHDTVLKMERTLAPGEPTEATLEALQRLLAEEDTHRAVLIAVRGERAANDRMRERLQNGTNLGLGFLQVRRGTAAVAPLPHDDELGMIASGSLKGQRAALLRVYNDLIEAAKLPPEQIDARLRQAMAGLLGSYTSPAVQLFLSGQLQTNQQCALVRSAVGALAAERYRRQYGRGRTRWTRSCRRS